MVRASVLNLVDVGSIPCQVVSKDFKKMVFTVFLLGVQHETNSTETKPEISLVVPLGKVLSGISPFFVADRPVPTRQAGAHQTKNSQTDHEIIRIAE